MDIFTFQIMLSQSFIKHLQENREISDITKAE